MNRRRERPRYLFTVLLSVILLSSTQRAHGQVPVPAPPPTDGAVFALVGGTVHPVSGPPVEDAVLIWKDGIIEALGEDLPIPEGAEIIDASGHSVYPGLISAHSILGLVEIGSIRQTSDHTEIGKFNPNARAAVAINPDSEHIAVTRANGVLTALVVPRGGRISGMSAAIRLDGWTWEEMTLVSPVGMHIHWPKLNLDRSPRAKLTLQEQRDKRREEYAELRNFLEDAGAWTTAQAAAGMKGIPRSEWDVKWEAMRPVVEGRLPAFVHANDLRQIHAALDWAREEGIEMVLMGGRDAYLVADRLATQDVPVIIGGVHRLPARDFEAYDTPFALAARLHEAGVRFCISTGGGASNERNLPYHAAMAWSYGLPHDEALRAITLYPAQILGLDDRLGALETGKEATFIVTDGDPLDIRSHVLRAFIAGREIELTSRHTRLYEKYRQRPLLQVD